jgi:hypothetical protein
MKVADYLPRISPAINENLVPRLDSLGFSHLLCSQEHLGPNLGGFFVEGVQRIKMRFGDDQEMNGSFRVDVLKNDQVFIFKKDFRRQLSGYNLTERTGHFYPFRISLSSWSAFFPTRFIFTIGYEEKEDEPQEDRLYDLRKVRPEMGLKPVPRPDGLFIDKSPIKW